MPGKHMVVALMLAFLAGGCGSVEQQILTWMPPDAVDQQAVALQMAYQQTGSPQAIRALLAQHVKQGMAPGEVSEVIGEPGHRVENDDWITNDGGTYQVGDEVWKWGPDDQGTSYFLVFRDRKLVNFNPGEFQ